MNLIYPFGKTESVGNFDVKYCWISSYKRGNGVWRQIGLTFELERSNTFCPGFANIASFHPDHSLRRQLVHNIQNDLRLLIAIYKVPVVRIYPLNSDGIHFECIPLGHRSLATCFSPFFRLRKYTVTKQVILENNDLFESTQNHLMVV